MCKFRVITETAIKLNRAALIGEMQILMWNEGREFSENTLNNVCDTIEEYLADKTVDFKGYSITFLEKEIAKRGYDYLLGDKSVETYFTDLVK